MKFERITKLEKKCDTLSLRVDLPFTYSCTYPYTVARTSESRNAFWLAKNVVTASHAAS